MPEITKELVNAVKRGFTLKTIVTTATTMTVIAFVTKQAKMGTFGTRVSTFTQKYL